MKWYFIWGHLYCWSKLKDYTDPIYSFEDLLKRATLHKIELLTRCAVCNPILKDLIEYDSE